MHRLDLDEKAWIRVGPETRSWKQGECLVSNPTPLHVVILQQMKSCLTNRCSFPSFFSLLVWGIFSFGLGQMYDTTYEHETMNEHPTQERVVLHVDFFNTLALTPVEIEVMQYIYSLREEFMKAEGVAKVGNQIL